jgi:hypothetical protein
MIKQMRLVTAILLCSSLTTACTPAAAPPVDPAARPLPDVTLDQCGPAPDAVTIYLEGQVTQRPRLVHPGRIRYPERLHSAEIAGGRVKFAFVIDSSGKVVESSLRTLEATAPGFVEPARGLTLTSRFVPARFEGHAVAVCTAQTINFTP